MKGLEKDCESILVSEEEIASICDRLAKEITADYEGSGRDLIFVVILKGSLMFAADLIRSNIAGNLL